MHVCFIVDGYPVPQDPFMPFIRNTVVEMARQGVQCTVIAPQSVTRALVHKVPIRPQHWQDTVEPGGAVVDIWQPPYITLSKRGGRFNIDQMIRAAKKVYTNKVCKQSVDLLYAHFWHMGVAASKVDATKPLFVACGESKIAAKERYAPAEIQQMLDQLSGTIYVSTKSYEESVKLKLQHPDNPYVILPNGYDPKRFPPLGKEAARQILGWPQDALVAAFVGAFDARKGVARVAQALTQVNQKRPVYSCFIGSGAESPVCPNQLHVGKVDHARVATYLHASDFFVLPTTNEGCCNAIIEALACGLPVISSTGSFNDDVLTAKNSIRVDPLDVQALEQAIDTLTGDPKLRKALAAGARESAVALTMERRVIKIIAFIESVMQSEQK